MQRKWFRAGAVALTTALLGTGFAAAPASASTRAETGRTPATSIDEYVDEWGADVVAAEKAKALDEMNKSATAEFGPMTSARAREFGQSTYFTADDIRLYVLEGEGTRVVAVPRYAEVTADGTTKVPVVDDAGAISGPNWSGPWGSENINFFSVSHLNDGGFYCNDTRATNNTKLVWAKQNDSSSTYDYWGVMYSGVMEVSQYSNNCDDYLNNGYISVRSNTSGGIWAAQDPLIDYNGGCSSVNWNASYQGVGLSGTVSKCEKWDVFGGNAGSAGTDYGVDYDNNDQCGAESREALVSSVVRVGQGGGANLYVNYAIGAGNQNHTYENPVNCPGG